MSVVSLGIAVDSSQAVSATKALDGFTAAAKPASAAASALEKASAASGVALAASAGGAKQAAAAHGGLSAQAMAAQHAIRSTVEQLAMGIPVTQALASQMNHLTFAASGDGGLTGAFTKAVAPLRGFLTLGTLAFGGVAVAIGAATLALNSYLNAQQRVNTSVLGAGRASGATAPGISSIASQGASATGLSVSEARDLASALAATGKVANDNILPIVKMGHDVALAFGTDAAGAVEILTKAFADPVRGADQLNQRLGFLDAATKQNIANLIAQNRQYDAQRVLLEATKSSLHDFELTQTATEKGWAAITNAASNAWTAVGKFFADGLGLGQSLESQLAKAKDELAALKAMDGTSFLDTNTGQMVGGDPAAIAAKQAQVNALAKAYDNVQYSASRAQAAQQSFLQQSTIDSLTPEIAERQALNNQLQVMQKLLSDLGNDEHASDTLKALGRTMEQVTAAATKAATAFGTYKTEFQRAIDAQNVQLKAVTAFSPAAKGDIAAQQTYNDALQQYHDESKAAALATNARTLAVKQATVAISEQNRAQLLAAKQAVTSAQLDINLVGKSIEQQTLLRANLAARQQLEQQASQNRTKFDQAAYHALVKQNEAQAKNVQLAAQAAANDNANFALQTAFLTDMDAQIASVQRQLHGNAWPQYMNDGLAATMRIADGMRQISQIGQDVTRGVFTDFETQIRNGASAMDALKTAGVNALGKIADKLAQMAADKLWSSAFGGSSGGGLLGLLGIGGGSAAASPGLSLTGTGGLYANGGAFDYGNVIPFARGGAFTNSIVSSPTLFKFADGTGMMGEAGPEAIMPLTRGPNGKLGVAALGAANSNSPQNININVNVSGARGSQEITEAVNEGVGRALTTYRKSPQFAQDVGHANIKASKMRVAG